MHRYLHLLAVWASVPFSRRRRLAFAQLETAGIFDAADEHGTQAVIGWAQDGEDRYFVGALPASGRYVDVGAHHPDRFSVTRLLYDRGWRGVNIDASPGFAALFSARRPEDVNVTALVGQPGERTFTRFTEAAISTLDEDRAAEWEARGWQVAGRETVRVLSLAEILADTLPPGPIDLLSVDVEGADLEVLNSHDWQRWPVNACLVEIDLPAHQVPETDIATLLQAQGLRLSRVWQRSALFERD